MRTLHRTAPGSVGDLRTTLAAAFPDSLEGLICAAGVDPTSSVPEEARRIACYAAPGANEGHVVHVDAILASSEGPATVRQLLIGKTEMGLGEALAVAVLCASIIHSREGTGA